MSTVRQGGRPDAEFRQYVVSPRTIEELHARWFETYQRLRRVRDRDGLNMTVFAQFQLLAAEDMLEDLSRLMGKFPCGKCDRGPMADRRACPHFVEDQA